MMPRRKIMQKTISLLEDMHSITGIPLSLIDEKGNLLRSFPPAESGLLKEQPATAALHAFKAYERDSCHPLIIFFDPGLLLGIMELDIGCYVLIGVVSPYAHTRSELMKKIGEAIQPVYLQQFCDRLLQQPLVTLEKMKDLICILSRLFENEISSDSILFVDTVTSRKLGMTMLDQKIFEQRETAEYHVPQDFETAICDAVESGNRALLERALFSPVQGHVGRMSANDLRQQKYAFICMAVLSSRAAIRGGLDPETAFSLSDLYCQRADLLTESPLLQNLTFTMLMDFCGKVREKRKRPASSKIIENCLQYISVHLHEPISLEILSDYCGLCGRSLSIRFKTEMGMGIPEYIHREKLQEARYLLRHTDSTLSQITNYLNYPSQSYFTQIFKKYEGLTPQQYRENGKR